MIIFTDGQTTAGGNPDDDAAAARAAGTEIFVQGGHLTLIRPTLEVRELLVTMGCAQPDGRIRRALDHSRRA